jgi:hypothetical protein
LGRLLAVLVVGFDACFSYFCIYRDHLILLYCTGDKQLIPHALKFACMGFETSFGQLFDKYIEEEEEEIGKEESDAYKHTHTHIMLAVMENLNEPLFFFISSKIYSV